jgi:short-subunit dehydrogenase
VHSGRIDVWINDAGVGALGKFDEIPISDHMQVIQTNLMGMLFGSYYALREFKRQQGGTLINIASALGKIPAPYYASYAASKYGVVGLSAALRQELRETGATHTHVCTILPMAMDTPFFEHASNYTGKKAVPIPPLCEPTRVINAIERLAIHPEDEVIVGGAGRLPAAMHSIAPKLTERYMSRQTHRTQIKEAPRARVTTGAVIEAMPGGRDVDGGWKSRQN